MAEWTEDDAARLRELDERTREFSAPGNPEKMPAHEREERTQLEQKYAAFQASQETTDAFSEPEVVIDLEAALKCLPTEALYAELQSRALESGATFPAIGDGDGKPKPKARKAAKKGDSDGSDG